MHHEANKQIKKNPAIYGFYKIMNNDIRKPKSIIVHNLDYIGFSNITKSFYVDWLRIRQCSTGNLHV